MHSNKEKRDPLFNLNKLIKSKTVVCSLLEQNIRYCYLKEVKSEYEEILDDIMKKNICALIGEMIYLYFLKYY